MNRSLEPLHSLAARLVSLQKRAKALGVFANDRELLECPRCGLMEDVTSTGLRFVQLADDIFRCPSCSQRVEVPAGEINKPRKQRKSRK